MPIKREIIYPFFLECCPIADDIFWEKIFEDLAYGKTPYGTYINKGFLCCSFKNKEFNYKIERKDPQTIYQEIYTLLTEKLGILSHKEKARKKLDFHEMEKSIRQSRQVWTSIRRKSVKDAIYEKFVIEMKSKHLLTAKQCRYTLATIFLAIMFKTITTKDIDYRDDKIQNIAGLEFSKGKVTFKKPLCSTECQISTDPDDTTGDGTTNTMSENWQRFLKSLRDR